MDTGNLGRKVKKLRTQRGLTVKQLAEKAGVSASYIYAIESGTRGTNIKKLARIASALGVLLSDIWSE